MKLLIFLSMFIGCLESSNIYIDTIHTCNQYLLKKIDGSKNLKKIRHAINKTRQILTMNNELVDIELIQHNDTTSQIFKKDHTSTVVFFLYGGSGNNGDKESYKCICSQISTELDATVVLLDYPLLPEHQFSTVITWIYEKYTYLIKKLYQEYKNIILFGDEIGADLCLELLIKLSTNNPRAVPKPTSQILFLPTFEYRNPDMSINKTIHDNYSLFDIRSHVKNKTKKTINGIVSMHNTNTSDSEFYEIEALTFDRKQMPNVDEDFLKRLPNTIIISLQNDKSSLQQKIFYEKIIGLNICASIIYIKNYVESYMSSAYFQLTIHDICEIIKENLPYAKKEFYRYEIPTDVILKVSTSITNLI